MRHNRVGGVCLNSASEPHSSLKQRNYATSAQRVSSTSEREREDNQTPAGGKKQSEKVMENSACRGKNSKKLFPGKPVAISVTAVWPKIACSLIQSNNERKSVDPIQSSRWYRTSYGASIDCRRWNMNIRIWIRIYRWSVYSAVARTVYSLTKIAENRIFTNESFANVHFREQSLHDFVLEVSDSRRRCHEPSKMHCVVFPL
jgi:hypothetical protein